MGEDESKDRDRQPSHLIRLDAYFIDETEVTNEEYAQCEAAGTCRPPASSNASYHTSYYGDPAFEDYPVIFVSWYDAEAFCQWRGGRLPSERKRDMVSDVGVVAELPSTRKPATVVCDCVSGRMFSSGSTPAFGCRRGRIIPSDVLLLENLLVTWSFSNSIECDRSLYSF